MKKDTIFTIIGLLSIISIPLFINKKYVESKDSTETKSAEGCGCGNGTIKVN
tara:strand:+ start:48 stop:203 length:156 start_codon:yes stop_codon:yes gene_type:complete